MVIKIIMSQVRIVQYKRVIKFEYNRKLGNIGTNVLSNLWVDSIIPKVTYIHLQYFLKKIHTNVLKILKES